MRNILLIEPGYRNKYPPLGLMKISAYHKKMGDRVVFFKGKSPELRDFIWDKIYITTLFTFHWKSTIDTIKYYKRSIYHTNDFYIGGIMASILQKEIYDEVRIKPHFGLLTSAKKIGEENRTNIDIITPDYDLLDEIDYKYPANNAYFSNTTKGCTRNCAFCAVPIIEPKYNSRIKITNQIKEIDKKYGARRNLLLLDNNVLASDCFEEIIDEIKDLGFYKGAKFIDPVMFEVYLERLKNEDNSFESQKIRERAIKEILVLKKKIKSREMLGKYLDIIEKVGINYETDMNTLIEVKESLIPIFNKYRNKASKERYVDYNQGVDLRYLTEEKMKKFSEINIRPLRIAFDHITLKDEYIEKCRLAEKYGIKELSNYLLYNYKDKPEDLYERLKINIELNEEFKTTKIYSFPMKYIPINETNRRKYIAKKWSLKSIRTIQAISNVTKGVIGAGKSFFYKAFGNDINEFQKLLIMPEDYIVYRFKNEENGNTGRWWEQYKNLSEKQKSIINPIIESNSFDNYEKLTEDREILEILSHYKRKQGRSKKMQKKTVKKEKDKKKEKKQIDFLENSLTLKT